MAETDADALSAALTILTLVTGEEWTRDKLLATNEQLRAHAARTLTKQGIGTAEAEAIVGDRWDEYGSPEPIVAQEVVDISATAKAEAIATQFAQPQAPTYSELRAHMRDRIEAWRKETNPDPGEDPDSSEGSA